MNEARLVPLGKGGEMLRKSKFWSTQWLAFQLSHQSWNISQLHLINCLKITVCSGTDCTKSDVGDHPETKARGQFGDRQWTGVQKSKDKRIPMKYEYCQFKSNVMGFMCTVASQLRSFEAHARPSHRWDCLPKCTSISSSTLPLFRLILPSCPQLRVKS